VTPLYAELLTRKTFFLYAADDLAIVKSVARNVAAAKAASGIQRRLIPDKMRKRKTQRKFVQFVQFVDRNAGFR
jgi:hypothetical protein